MKRTVGVTVGLLTLGLLGSVESQRTPAQTPPKSSVFETSSGYRIERAEFAGTCVVIVSKGDRFTQAPCE